MIAGWCLLWLVAPVWAEPVTLDAERSHSLAGHLEVWVDPANQMGFGGILALADAGRFRPIPGYLTQSYGKEAVWVRFQLRRLPGYPEEAYLQFGPPVLDFLDVYVQTAEAAADWRAYRHDRLGDHLPVAARPGQSPFIAMPLRLPPFAARWVYVKVSSSSVLNLTGSVETPALWVRKAHLRTLMHGGWLSVALLIASAGLLFWLRTGDRLYAYFAAYILGLFVNRCSATGVLPLVWPAQAHRLADGFVTYGANLAVVCFVLFGRRLFEPAPGVRRLFRLALLAAIADTLSSPFVAWGHIQFASLAVVTVVLALLMRLSAGVVTAGDRSGWLYFASFASLFAGCLVQILRTTGLLEATWWNLNTFQISNSVHILLLTLALAERLYLAEKKALAAERDAKRHAEELAAGMTLELRGKQRDLEQTLERQVRFIAMVSHEYRTPLAVIRANLDLLAMMPDDRDANLAFALGKMKRAVSRLVEVLEVNLHKIRYAGDNLRLHRSRVSLPAAATEVIAQARDFWPNRAFHLDWQGECRQPLHADAKLLKTALLNLLDNAVKYSPADTPIQIAIRREGAAAVVAVADRGCGIPAAERGKVFEKYYRVPGNQDETGTGLGLYLVAKIVEEHQGSVGIDDNRPGVRVEIRLPAGGGLGRLDAGDAQAGKPAHTSTLPPA